MKDPFLSISSIKKKAFDGLLADKGLRSLCWKVDINNILFLLKIYIILFIATNYEN